MRGIAKYYKIFYVSLIILLVFASHLLYKNENESVGFYDDFQMETWNEGWTCEEIGGKVTLPVKMNIKKGTYTSICRYLEYDTEDEYICIRTDHGFVRVYADEKLIYTFGEENDILFGKTPGSIWNVIPIKNLEAGTKLTVSIMSPYSMYSGKFREIIKGSRADILLYIFDDCAPLLIMTLIPMLVAVFFTLVHICFRKEFGPIMFVNTGGGYLMLALWSFTETRGWQFFFHDAYVIQMVNFISFSLVITMAVIILRRMGFINNRKHFRVLVCIGLIVPVLQIFIQILEIADFFEMLFVIHIMDVVNVIVFSTDFIVDLYKKKENTKNIILGTIIYISIFVGIVLDLMDFYVWDRFGNGFFCRIEFLIIITAAGVRTAQKAVSIYAGNIEKITYQRMAYTDDMTGLKNRRAFERDIETLEQDDTGVAVLYVDMNGLKQINDTFGHQKGDEAIKVIADKLKEFAKQGDFCYRLGGDEFCVISSTALAEKLEEECARINEELEQYRFDVDLSIAYGGMDYCPEKCHKLKDIMRNADSKMYARKQQMKGETDGCISR